MKNLKIYILGLILATLSGCGVRDSITASAEIGGVKIASQTFVKKVCLEGVKYYATWIQDARSSGTPGTYLVVGGPVYEKGNSTPTQCF